MMQRSLYFGRIIQLASGSRPWKSIIDKRSFTSSLSLQSDKQSSGNETRISLQSYFSSNERSKETFLAACQVFRERNRHLRGHTEFIYAALKHMEEFGVHKDLEMYKGLLDLMPKGKMIPQNMFQAEFMHYPKQQQCAIDVLEQMETHGVMPDTETEMILVNTFGKKGHPVRKFGRMMYWMPKFKNASPWSLPDTVPNEALELAKLAVARMCSVDPSSKISILNTTDVESSVDDTWVVSGQSHIQQELLSQLPHSEPVKVEGPFRIFLRDKCCGYFILRAEARPPPPIPTRVEQDDVTRLNFWFTGQAEELEEKAIAPPLSVHEQEDGIILGICATGTSSRDSLLSWVRLLEVDNPHLANLTIVFTQASPVGEVMVVDQESAEQIEMV